LKIATEVNELLISIKVKFDVKYNDLFRPRTAMVPVTIFTAFSIEKLPTVLQNNEATLD